MLYIQKIIQNDAELIQSPYGMRMLMLVLLLDLDNVGDATPQSERHNYSNRSYAALREYFNICDSEKGLS